MHPPGERIREGTQGSLHTYRRRASGVSGVAPLAGGALNVLARLCEGGRLAFRKPQSKAKQSKAYQWVILKRRPFSTFRLLPFLPDLGSNQLLGMCGSYM